MLNIGFSELLLFGIIALVVLGPDKLPTAVRTAGRWYARLRFMLSNLQQDIEKELQLSELRDHLQQELDRIKLIEAQMQVQLNQMSGEIAELNHSELKQSELKQSEAHHAELNYSELKHTAANIADVQAINVQAVSTQDSPTSVSITKDTSTAPSINIQTMSTIYFSFKCQRHPVFKVPYTTSYRFSQHSEPPAMINAYPQTSLPLQLESA